MTVHRGPPTVIQEANVIPPAAITLVGGATVAECLRTAGDGKYVQIVCPNTNSGNANNVYWRFQSFEVPGFDPLRVHGDMAILRFRILSLTSSGSTGSFNRAYFSSMGSSSGQSGYQTLNSQDNSAIYPGMPATSFTMYAPIHSSYNSGSVSNNQMYCDLSTSTSGGVGPTVTLRIDFMELQYGEADAFMLVQANVGQNRVTVGTDNWANPQQGCVEDGLYASVSNLSNSLDRFLPPFSLPAGAKFQGVDFLDYLPNASSTGSFNTWQFDLGYYPLSVPNNTTPAVKFKMDRINTPVNVKASTGLTNRTLGFGPGWDWAEYGINGFPGIELSRLLNTGYVLALGLSSRVTPYNADAIAAKVYYDRGPGGGPLIMCDV